MLDPWNDSSLQPPPNNTFTFDTSNCPIDFYKLTKICNNLKKVLSKQLPLHNEGALLARFIYKFDKKFRNDIGYRNLKKVNSALRKYLLLNLYKDVETFLSLLHKDDEVYYIPSRQMLQYLLVRIVSLSMLMKRICICSKITAIHYMDRVKRGESHWMSLMPFALLSRIWSLSNVLLQHGCTWYSQLYPYLNDLQQKGIEFLPGENLLPADLAKWLDIENIDCYGQLQWYSKRSIQIKVNFSEEEDINLDNILDYVKDINEEKPSQDLQSNIPSEKAMKESLKASSDEVKIIDKGESISREYFQSFFKQPDKLEKVKSIHSADLVTNKTTLVSFIASEEAHRNNEDNQSLTRHLSFMQWQSLKSSLISLSESLSKNRKIERKFKKLFKEKCLDYM